MSIITASKIDKYYGSGPVLKSVSFNVNEGDRIGIVGANGAGKTTLAKIIIGEIEPDSGQLFISPDSSTGYLRQHDSPLSSATVHDEMMSAFAWQIEAEKELERLAQEAAILATNPERKRESLELLHRHGELLREFEANRGFTYRSEVEGMMVSFAFPEDFRDRPVSALSGGEKTRLALAALLLRNPSVLILDEPTNHLDLGTLGWLEQYLSSYLGTLLIISHDRYFLDRTVNRIFEIENNRLTAYPGNYTAYAAAKKEIYAAELKRYEHQQEEIRRQEDMIRRFKERGTEKLVKRAKSREKQLSKMDRLQRPGTAGRRMRLTFEEDLKSGNDVMKAVEVSKSFPAVGGTRVLFKDVSFDIKKGERICMVGANGIGKTTLLRMLTEREPASGGFIIKGQNVRIGYYDQHQSLLNPKNTVLEEVHSAYRLYTQTELRSILGRFLFIGDDVFKKVGDLAGGERAKLALLKLMMSGSNFLVMDEPTNHLDMAAKEVFEEALLDFPGTLLIVSHDRYLLSKIPTSIYELTQGGLNIYKGSYDYYTEKRGSIASGKVYLSEIMKAVTVEGEGDRAESERREVEKQRRAAERRAKKEAEAAERRKARELQALEKEITDLECRIKRIENELCKEEVFTDPQRASELSEELAKAGEELENLHAEWFKLHDEEV